MLKLLRLVVVNGIIATVTLCIVVAFVFCILLPFITNHGSTVKVPNLVGLQIDEANRKIKQIGLRCKVSYEAVFTTAYNPSDVISQYPFPDDSVKPNRVIYLTINPKTPPEVTIPNFIDHSILYAYRVLMAQGLIMGNITYEDDIAHNAVLKLYCDGIELHEGDIVHQGNTIDFTVGTSSPYTVVPNLVGTQLCNLDMTLLENCLSLGNIDRNTPDDATNTTQDQITRQSIQPGTKVKCGTKISVCI